MSVPETEAVHLPQLRQEGCVEPWQRERPVETRSARAPIRDELAEEERKADVHNSGADYPVLRLPDEDLECRRVLPRVEQRRIDALEGRDLERSPVVAERGPVRHRLVPRISLDVHQLLHRSLSTVRAAERVVRDLAVSFEYAVLAVDESVKVGSGKC